MKDSDIPSIAAIIKHDRLKNEWELELINMIDNEIKTILIGPSHERLQLNMIYKIRSAIGYNFSVYYSDFNLSIIYHNEMNSDYDLLGFNLFQIGYELKESRITKEIIRLMWILYSKFSPKLIRTMTGDAERGAPEEEEINSNKILILDWIQIFDASYLSDEKLRKAVYSDVVYKSEIIDGKAVYLQLSEKRDYDFEKSLKKLGYDQKL